MRRRSYRGNRPGRLRVHIVPFLVWVAAVVCVAGLFYRRAQRFEVLGLAQGPVHQIAATCTGRLKSVPVQLFQQVNVNDEVAEIDTVLDNEHLHEELLTAQAEIDRLQAEVAATEDRMRTEAANLQGDRVVDERRFSVDVENASLQVLGLETQLETDRLMLDDLELNRKMLLVQAQGRLPADKTAFYDLQKAKAERNRLLKAIDEKGRLLRQAQSDFAEAQQRRDEFAKRQPQHPSVDSALEVISKAIAVQQQRIEELKARRVALVLRSPVHGVVSQILARPGEAVLAGDPILTIAEVEPSEIVAYAGEDQISQIKEGMPVELVKNTEPARIMSSQVLYVGPMVEQMPPRLWRNPNIPQWGCPILISIPPSLELRPGELVAIRGL